jgi:hypothetical protein
MISDNPVHMSHVTFILPFFRNSNNIWWQVQYMKLYIMQFSPISYYFQAYSLRTEHLSKTQSVFPQCHRPSVTPTGMKILWKHTHTHTLIFQQLFLHKAGRTANHYKTLAVSIAPNEFPLIFLILLVLFFNVTRKYFNFPKLPKFQTVSASSFFFKVWYPCCDSRIHNKNRSVACQFTTSL